MNFPENASKQQKSIVELYVVPTVFNQTCKMGEILTKTCFSPQSEPHTAKPCFSVVLKHFRENSQVTSLFCLK